ncbi:MAG: cation:proton antiporter, partial [Coleofasciculus sp. S288]|nr:cation:proton antiporter [Coleofasciculus sp. S288]
NTKRVLLAAADREISSLAFKQTVTVAKNIAAELKATLELVMVGTRSRGSRSPGTRLDLESLGLSADTPVTRVRGSFVQTVSRMLHMDDLLILRASSHPNYAFGMPEIGVEPEAIARTHPDTSMIVVHFPI